jgi:hypothetical protein
MGHASIDVVVKVRSHSSNSIIADTGQKHKELYKAARVVTRITQFKNLTDAGWNFDW